MSHLNPIALNDYCATMFRFCFGLRSEALGWPGGPRRNRSPGPGSPGAGAGGGTLDTQKKGAPVVWGASDKN